MLSLLLIIFLFLLLIEILVCEILLLLESRQPEKAKMWLNILAFLPVYGILIYLFFGYRLEKHKLFKHKHLRNKRLKQKVKRQNARLSEEYVVMGEEMDSNKKLVRLSQQNSLAPLRINNRVRLLTNGHDKFPALLEALENAREHIHIEYYIFRDDQIGRKLSDLLIRKSQAGVEVKLIIDGVGSYGLSQTFLNILHNANIKVEWFFPVRFPYLTRKLNYRNHRKIVVIDGKVGFLGGLNIGDEYLSRDPKLGFWRDTHLLVEGEAVHFLQSVFLNDWFFVTGERLEDAKYYPTPQQFERQLTQIIPGGPDSGREPIQQMFFTALTGAEQRIWIETPYFIPDESMMMALKTASLSGVDVRLIVQGIADHKISYWATQSYFADLFSAGIKVYRYKKGILHSKAMIIDDRLGIVGSANFDMRSFRLNFEISAICYNRDFVLRLEEDFRQDFRDSQLEDPEVFRQRDWSLRFGEINARLLSPLL